jgi:Na+/H+-dicarboxylate symporter
LHPRLVTCLLVSGLAAVVAAASVFIAGGGWLAALLTYSCTGSVVTLALATLVMPGEARKPHPKLLPPPAASARQETRAVA